VPDLPLTGRCLCGGVRFEVVEAPLSAGYCHCTRCQRRTGSGSSAQAKLARGSLHVLAGEDLVTAWVPPNGMAKAFCSSCGAHLWSLDPAEPETKSVRLAALDEDPGIRPSYRQFVAYAAPWEPIPDDGLPRFDERRPPSTP
jgi:hypothetical protein